MQIEELGVLLTTLGCWVHFVPRDAACTGPQLPSVCITANYLRCGSPYGTGSAPTGDGSALDLFAGH